MLDNIEQVARILFHVASTVGIVWALTRKTDTRD